MDWNKTRNISEISGEGVTPYIRVSNDEHENARKKRDFFYLSTYELVNNFSSSK